MGRHMHYVRLPDHRRSHYARMLTIPSGGSGGYIPADYTPVHTGHVPVQAGHAPVGSSGYVSLPPAGTGTQPVTAYIPAGQVIFMH